MSRTSVSLAALLVASMLVSGCGSRHAASLPGLTPAKLVQLTAAVRQAALENGVGDLTGGTVYATTGRGANRAAQMGYDLPHERVYLVVFPGFVCLVDRAVRNELEVSVGYSHVNTSKLGPGVPISLGSNWFWYGLVAVLVALVGGFALARRRFGFGGGGPRVAPCVLVLLAAAGVGAFAWPTVRALGFCGNELLTGANISHASVLALVCGVVGAVALRRLRSDSRYVAVALIVAAVLLGICVALVAWDSAAYAIHNPGGGDDGDVFSCPDVASTTIHHVWYLYPVWGSAIALLLLQSVRALRYVRLPSAGEAVSGADDAGE